MGIYVYGIPQASRKVKDLGAVHFGKYLGKDTDAWFGTDYVKNAAQRYQYSADLDGCLFTFSELADEPTVAAVMRFRQAAQWRGKFFNVTTDAHEFELVAFIKKVGNRFVKCTREEYMSYGCRG